MKLGALREPSDAFSYLKVENSRGATVTRISGTGELAHEGQINSQGYTSKHSRANGASHFEATVEGETVYSLSEEGDVQTEGFILAANGTFLATQEGVSATALALDTSLSVKGDANVVQSLSIGPKYPSISRARLSVRFDSNSNGEESQKDKDAPPVESVLSLSRDAPRRSLSSKRMWTARLVSRSILMEL